MNWRAVRAIVRKDLRVIARSKAVMLPLVLVPLVMLVLMPALVAQMPQPGAVVVLPILLLLAGQVTGVMYFSSGLVATLGAVLWAFDGLLLWLGGRTFRPGELLVRL